MLAAIGALVLVALVAAAIALRTSRSNEAAANVAATTHAMETATQAKQPEPVPTTTAVPPTIAVAATATATATATVTATAPVKPVATARPPIVRDFPTTKPGTKPGCNPPYTVDANGVKPYKVECL